jgi:hypothetical protein
MEVSPVLALGQSGFAALVPSHSIPEPQSPNRAVLSAAAANVIDGQMLATDFPRVRDKLTRRPCFVCDYGQLVHHLQKLRVVVF